MNRPGKDEPTSPGSPPVDAPSTLIEPDVRRSESFARWVEPEIEVLLRVARSLTGSWADAEDVVQETLIRAYRAIDGFDGRHPRAWLLTILRRTHLNSLRRTRPDLIEDQSLERRRPAFGQSAAASSPETLVGDRMLDDDIERALGELDERFRTAVLLVDVNQLTYAEAAEVLDVPLGTLMSRLSRGRARLRKQLRHRQPRSQRVPVDPAPVPATDHSTDHTNGHTTDQDLGESS